MSVVLEARQFAAERHGAQMYGTEPYTKHLEDVASVLLRFGITDPEMIAAALLHDVVEDTATTVEEIRERFGERVAALVHAVTNEKGANRRERHRLTYPKMAGKNDETTLKLADRIANTEESIRRNPGLFSMYSREWENFREALGAAGETRMWAHLDHLMSGGWNGAV